ncbi:rhomboid family intramembrane serine protease [Pedobacter sp. LMG 31464]|uniref:Rhomboid family intramembrane serine protease n=1 Tax=Pedobacter planticolens TaxID=2679964 RepID=A0A923IUV5_9SPHI|nr:rhomboid family intramembrane serine protease [Pedobacter planticolens]MBB2146385.1 rhomboid family intramembrane serine protease [Pedobacter planticolens]
MNYLNDTPVATIIFIFTLITSIYAFNDHQLYGKFMLHPYTVSKGKKLYTFITSGLIHADWTHLLFNMFTFYFFAFKLERLIGHWQFGLLYFLSLILSDIPTVIKHKDHFWYNSLGASGAISAVLFSYIMFDPTTLLLVMFIPMPAILFAVLYLYYSWYMSKKGQDNIGHDAHFFGALTGLLFTLIFVPGIIPNFIEKLTLGIQYLTGNG